MISFGLRHGIFISFLRLSSLPRVRGGGAAMKELFDKRTYDARRALQGTPFTRQFALRLLLLKPGPVRGVLLRYLQPSRTASSGVLRPRTISCGFFQVFNVFINFSHGDRIILVPASKNPAWQTNHRPACNQDGRRALQGLPPNRQLVLVKIQIPGPLLGTPLLNLQPSSTASSGVPRPRITS